MVLTWMNSIALYGGVVHGSWYASAQIANGWYREDMQRLLQLGALMAPVGNAATGRYMAGALEGGRVFHIGGMRVVPFADVRYQRLDLGGFAEQGGLGYGLKAEAHTVGRLQTGLGLRAERGWRLANGMQVAFDGSAGWQHTLDQHGDVFNASFTGFNDWLPVEGIGLSRNTTVLRAGVSLWPTSSFGLRLGYMREQDQRERAKRGLPVNPVDERFLAALEHGLPECSGVALGFDRLVMCATDARHLDEVLTFPFERA